MGRRLPETKSTSRDRLENRIRTLAGRQFGLVTRDQLIELGMPTGTIDGRVAASAIIVVHPGVYAYGAPRPDALAQAMAAVLACRQDAFLSHWSAGFLWGALADWRLPAHVTLSAGDRRPPGVSIHRCKTFTSRDRRRHRGILVSSPARTVLDLAPLLPDRRRVRVVNDLIRRKRMRIDQLRDVIDRNPLHAGAKLLRPFVEDFRGATASGLEDLFQTFCHKHELPLPLINTTVNGFEVDAYFEAERLIVEVDSREYHSDPTAFHTDRERDAINLAAGYPTVRITDTALESDNDADADRLHQILKARRPPPDPTLPSRL